MNSVGNVSPKYIESKAELLAWSAKARELQNTIELQSGVRPSINEILLGIYELEGYGEKFNTFAGWQAEGYRVKKGAKSLKIWGAKRSATKGESAPEAELMDGQASYSYFPICYIFSEKQVERMD